MLAQNIFEKSNPTTRDAKGRTMDRYLTDELKTFAVYGCRVIVTNTSSSMRDCQLLMQVRLVLCRRGSHGEVDQTTRLITVHLE